MKYLSLLFLLFIFSCTQQKSMLQRVEQLGEDLLAHSRQDDRMANTFPDDCQYLGDSTFAKLQKLNKDIEIHVIKGHNNELNDAEYYINYGTELGLGINYDTKNDILQIQGYSGVVK